MKIINIMMEVDSYRHETWFRISADTLAVRVRDYLSPGTRVSISGVVSKYESSGAYRDFEGDDVPMSDRLQLSAWMLELSLSDDGGDV